MLSSRDAAQPGEELVGAGGVHGHPAADRDVSQRRGQVGLPDADRPQDQGAVACFGEPQGGQVGEQLTVVGQVVQLVPGVEPHAGVEPGRPGAQRRRAGLAAGDLVGQDQLQERGVGHLLLPGQDQPFGQGLGHLAELELLEGADQVRTDRVDRPAPACRRRARRARRAHGALFLLLVVVAWSPPGIKVS